MASFRILSRTSSSTSPGRPVSSLCAYGRSPAYRRISSLPLNRNLASATRRQVLSARLPLLRSTILPETVRLEASQPRCFHVSPSSQKPAPAAAEAKSKPDPAAEDAKKPEAKKSEAKKSEAKKSETKKSEAKENNAEEEEKKADEEGGQKEKSEENGKEEKKDDLPPPPPHGDKTPWQVFMETMQSEFKQSKEWNESTKAIADSAHKLQESEQVRKAREAYEKTSSAVSSATSDVLKTTAGAIGKGAEWTWETKAMKGVRKGANAAGKAIDDATKPIRETEAYKNIKDTIDDGSSSRYGGWVEKEERKKRRALRDQKQGVNQNAVYEEDPNAGTNVTLHKDAAWKEAWRDFRDQNKFVQGLFSMKSAYQESENPLVSTARSITDSIAGFFSENETAEVIKKFRAMDPNFQLEPFLQELREYMLPEVLDAYVKGDTETLKQWLSAAQYSVYEALTKQYLQAGLKSDGRILDIRHVDILRARMLEPGDIPVFIITCRTQEVHVYRKDKTGELAAGMEDKVQLVTYAIGMTRMPDDVNNPETRGWRLIEMQKSGRDYI